ncbi:MAG: hypothetical protein JXQ90_09985 [Cyclobacteriaceae bacterium]
MVREILIVLFVFVTLIGFPQTYQSDVAKLSQYTAVIELVDGESRIAIAPAFQGKVLTSTHDGQSSNGWLDRKTFDQASLNGGEIGGEDRVWIGPLGSQFSFYYQQIKPLDGDNWKVPATMNEQPYKLVKQSESTIEMLKQMHLVNWMGTEFDLQIARKIRMLDRNRAERMLGMIIPPQQQFVAYESAHTLTNSGSEKWDRSTGLATVWSAGLFAGSPQSVVIIPLTQQADLERIFQYFGPLDSSRLVLKNNVLLFKTDGNYRSKIGVPPELAPAVYGAYDPGVGRLTIVQYKKDTSNLYFNSRVTVQDEPYRGEVVPVYNNGSMDYTPQSQSTFYELESTAAMKELAPGETIDHFHRIYHFGGDITKLNKTSTQLLGITLEEATFKP